jgi:hypothetical protein
MLLPFGRATELAGGHFVVKPHLPLAAPRRHWSNALILLSVDQASQPRAASP